MIKNFLKDESGAGLIEYVLLCALIAIATIAAMSFVADEIEKTFYGIGNELNSANTAAGLNTSAP